MLKKVLIFFTLALWPVNLFTNNTLPNFISYVFPAVLLFISYFNPIFILGIGIISPKLALIPLLFLTIGKKSLILIAIALAIFAFQFKELKGQSVFIRDYEGEQLVIRNIHLYPNVLMARIFQNKPRIYLNKIVGNFFTLADLNNYFFGLHPRPILIDNQNLFKYPVFAIIFFLYGLIRLKESNFARFITISSIAAIISLSLLTNFDRNDFILFVPISLIIIHGIKKIF